MLTYRILHQRGDGMRPVLMFQNRIIHAESAVHALRQAMRARFTEMEIDVRSEQLALARPLTTNAPMDFWRAEFEPLPTIRD